MINKTYLMENDEETKRLDLKTNGTAVEDLASWAGIDKGMRVADMGFGSGKTTWHLNRLVMPSGSVVGFDFVPDRIAYAKKHYQVEGVDFIQKDIRSPFYNGFGNFDFVWVRFVLEYYKSESYDIIKNIGDALNPGGILVLVDLDLNCLCHYGLTKRMENAVHDIMDILEVKANFDPYAGRKLYSYLYDMGYQDIDVKMIPHHLIFGNLGAVDEFNWIKKAEVVVKKMGYKFKDYSGGYNEFYNEFIEFFSSPRRFTYTPLICCRGKKPEK